MAIWGTSIDVIYPKENKRLAEEIVSEGGAIISEFPLGTFPAPQNFPIRNRVISGLSVGVLVIEAGEHSGTRVTARCGDGAESRCVCGAGKRDEQECLGAEYADQAGGRS